LIYGIGLGIETYAFGNSAFFYRHTHYYDKTFGSDNNLDPKYRINYVDHRGKYYGPFLTYSWGTLYYYYFNDITLISLATVFGSPRYNYKGPFPTFDELKKMNSFTFDTIPVLESKFEGNILGEILIRNKIVTVKKQHKMQEGWLFPCFMGAITDSLQANGIIDTKPEMVTYAYTKYYPLIILSDPYMSDAPYDFGGKLFMYDCSNEKFVAEMLIPDSNYYNSYMKK
jgi:hypothetical protein